jgi:flavorubredoxin
MKVFVVYDTKYGNTKLVAEEIVKGIEDVGGIETAISYVKEVDLERVADSDAILIGAPNHMGGPSWTISGFIDKLGKVDLRAKGFAAFDTYAGTDFEKAVRKMEERINRRIPGMDLIAPGLSVKVQGMKGPIADGELPKCRDFGRRIANKLKA